MANNDKDNTFQHIVQTQLKKVYAFDTNSVYLWKVFGTDLNMQSTDPKPQAQNENVVNMGGNDC